MTAANALQSASGAFDGIYIGQLLGVNAIAAVSAFFPVMFLLLATVIGLASGATVLIGQAWGANDRDRVRTIAATAVAMALLAGLVVSLAGALLAPAITGALGTPAAVQLEAARYARTIMIGMPVIFILWLITSLSRGVGDAATPLLALAVATVTSLMLTPTFILVARFGVASAAVSNIAAYLIASVWLVRRWRRTNHPLAPGRLAALRVDGKAAKAILRIGVPAALQMLAVAAAEMALIHLVNRYGPAATAIYGAINQAMIWVQLPIMSLGITTAILSSHAIGAGRPERIGTIVRTGQWLNIAITGGIVVLATLGAKPLIGLTIVDAATAATAARLLQNVLWSLVALGGASVLTGAMRSDGTVLVPTILSAFAILGLEIPAAYLFEARFGLPGIFMAYAAAFLAMVVLQTGFFRFFWHGKPRRRLG